RQQGGPEAGQGTCRRAGRDARGPLGLLPPRRPAHRPAPRVALAPLPSAGAAGPGQGVDREPGPAGAAGGTVPRLVAAHARREGHEVSSRDLILGRVRRALADATPDDTPYEQAVSRSYLSRHGERSVARTVDLLAEN